MATAAENRNVQLKSAPSDHESPGRFRARRRWGRLAFGLVLIAVAGAGIAYAVTRGSESRPTLPIGALTQTLRRQPLRITVVEDGNVESANNVDVKCQVAGGGTILWIVEDGKNVEEGEVLVRLDESAILEQLNAQKIVFEKAMATKIQAEQDLGAAAISVEEYKDGTFVQSVQTLETQITVAMENLRSAENMLGHTERMARRGFATSLQLEADQFAVQRAKLDLAAAETAKKVLVDYTKPKTIKQLEALRDAADARAKSEDAAFKLEQARLERLQQQMKNCEIRAPQKGMVVWHNESSGRRSSEVPQVEEGALVREQQTLIRLPDLTKMQVKVNVHETRVEQIRIGMPAKIRIQDRVLKGTVVAIANQPQPSNWFSPDVKEYATSVKIDGEADGLKPGMTAEVEILVAETPDALTAPVSAVVEQGGRFFAWVQTAKGPERRPILLGLTNDKVIEIKDGIGEGEAVLLNPRAMVAEAREDSPAKDKDEESKDTAQEGSSPQGPSSGSGASESKAATPLNAAPASAPSAEKPPASQPEATQAQGGAGGPQAGDKGSKKSGRGGGDFFARFDGNKDGKISREEAPEPMKARFDEIDKNKDGAIDRSEGAAMRGGRSKRPPGGGGEGSP